MALGGGMGFLMCNECFYNLPKALIVSGYSAGLWILLWLGNGTLTDYIDTKISWVTHPLRRIIVGISAMLVYTTLAVIFLIFVFRNFGLNISNDAISFNVFISIGITIIISVTLHARAFFKFWREAAIQAEKFKKETVISQYESLKNQVNPHFLFNSLNSLTNLVYENQDQAAKFILQLANVYRYVLENKDRELVSLSEEWTFTESYLFLEKIRFGDSLQIEFDFKGHELERLAPLSLQMLVENAIKHNVVSEEDPLKIQINIENDFLIIKNNLQKKNIVKGSSGIGLNNIKARYQYLVSDRAVEILQSGKEFIVKLPLLPAP